MKSIIYYHIEDLGNELNRTALRGDFEFEEPRVKIHDADRGMQLLKDILDQHGRAAISICLGGRFGACPSKTACHRIRVANLARHLLGVQVVHL